MNEDLERVAFHHYMKKTSTLTLSRKPGGEYVSAVTETAWHAWKGCAALKLPEKVPFPLPLSQSQFSSQDQSTVEVSDSKLSAWERMGKNTRSGTDVAVPKEFLNEFLNGQFARGPESATVETATIDMSKPGWQRFIEEKLQAATLVCADAERWKKLLLVLEAVDGDNPQIVITQKDQRGECRIELRTSRERISNFKWWCGQGKTFERALDDLIEVTKSKKG